MIPPIAVGQEIERALLTIPEAARYLSAASEWAVRRLITGGKLPYIRVGKRFCLRKSDLDAWIAKNIRREGEAAGVPPKRTQRLASAA